MKARIVLFIFCMIAIDIFAQENIVPHYPTVEEEKSMSEYLGLKKFYSSRSIPTPPPGPVRTMAEWEQIQALIITWAGQTTILKEIVRNAVRETKVLIITTNPSNVTSQLTSAGIPLDSVQFVETPYNSIWVRDYGPWTVYKNDVDSLYLIDWIYNRPRAQDDATPVAIAEFLNIPIYEATVDPDDFVHTGGNHLPDGMGTAFSSMLVLEENNDKTEAEIDWIAKNYLGVNQYIKFPTLPFDGIHHLDMHMRILDEETIMFGEYPEGIADGPQINANIEYLLEEFQTAFGHPFRIIRIPMPPENNLYPDHGGDYRTYTNSIFINKTILVPTYEEKYDTTALRIYRENLPGYNVVGINCNSIISSLGALHCITKLVGVNEPLLIAHARLRDSDEPENQYPVHATIKHHSGINEANLFYRLSGDSVYTMVPMVITDSLSDEWTSIIPAYPSGSEVQYYIQAKSNSGKEQVRPIVAPDGYFKFKIYGEPVNQPPVVNIIQPLDGSVFEIEEDSTDIEIGAIDVDGEIVEGVLFINGDSITTFDTIPYIYHWTFPGEGEYQIFASVTDDKGAETISEEVQVTIENTTSNNSVSKTNLHVYPNPVEDILWIENTTAGLKDISITNIYGQKLTLPVLLQEDLFGYDFSGIQPGVYFLSTIIERINTTICVVKM